MRKKLLIGALLMLAQALPGMAGNSYGLPDNIQDGNILHCFDWTFNDIKAMLPQIAEAGFGAVQVSPVQGNANTNAEWYFAYMPYDFAFKPNGNGSRQQLQALCSEAHTYGIKVIVDVVANHVNRAAGYHDTWWDSNGRVRWEGGIDYGNRYSITHGQLGDYGDVNSESTEVQQRAKAFVQDLKSIGVDGIRWDAAKHIGLPSEGCQFWPAVTNGMGMYHYGEILDSPGGNANQVMQEYTNYMSVTDNGYCDQVRGAVCNGSVPGNHAGWAAGAISDKKVVYWGESHDDYSNEWHATTYISQDKIDRSWAICSCRAGAAGLYFSRPSGTDRNAIKMGQKGSTHFTSKEIAAINHLRNAAVGTKDYYTGEGGIACITREGVGAAIIVGGGGSRQVTVKNGGGYVPAGTYTDEVSGNSFTVTASTISGQVGPTGIAVIYGAAVKYPAISFNPNGGSFRSETLSVTATLSNATSGWYKIDGGQQTNVNGSATFTIGQGVEYGKNIVIDWSATGAEGTKTGQVTFKKVDPNASVFVYYNNPGHWNPCNAYIYSETAGEVAAWPGQPMAKSGEYWSIEVPEAFTEGGMVIFNNGSDQYPAAQQPGLAINGKSMICLDNTVWKEYDGTGNNNGDNGNNNGDNGNGGGDTSQDGTYVYLKNNYGWNAPTVWAWNEDGSCVSTSNWPGDMMTNVGGDLWKWTAPAGKVPTKIIFSNSGQNQTADLQYTNKATYDCSGTIVATGDNGNGNGNGNGGDTSQDGTYVYLKNTANWSNPTVWAWNQSEGCTSATAWPGDAMTRDGDLFKWTAPAGKVPTQIIFSDGGNSQTADLAYVNKATYDCSGQIVTNNGNGDDNGNNNDNPDPGPNPGNFTQGTNLQTDYFKVNPSGAVGTNRTVNVVGGNTGSQAMSNWTASDLIAQGVARDICQAFKGVHERPIVDSYALYASYDSQNLYLGVQYVYTVWDEWGEGFQAGESKPYNMDGAIMLAFDLDPSKSCDGTLVDGNSVWRDKKYTTFNNGMDCLWMGSTKPGVGTPGLFFPNAAGKFDYTDPASCKKSNVTYGYADGLLPSITAIWGQGQFGYDPALLEGNTGFVDLTSEVSRLGGSNTAHTFYEFKFPLADLGINESYIKNYGIGVMVVDMYGASAHSCLPYDPSMFDNVFNEYSMDPSSSQEKEDVDVITYGFARVGKLASGIEAEKVSSVKVYTAPGAIRIAGCEGKMVTIAGIDGRIFANTVADADSFAAQVAPGFYIVRCGSTTAKVLVK